MATTARPDSSRRAAPAAGFTDGVSTPPDTTPRWPRTLLRRSAAAWATVAIAGQWLFVVYLLGFYGYAVLIGDMSAWSRVMPGGIVPGDTAGNIAIVVHLAIAVFVLSAGAIQLSPVVRRRAPVLHRWSGRLYLSTALITSVAGLYLVWTRGSVGNTAQHVAITGNAIILITCAIMAWRRIRARDIAAHRRWALRTFLAASGVFFFRLFLTLWITINRGPVGFDPKTFSGPFLTALAFAVYVFVPLTVLEGVLRAETSRHTGVRVAMSGVLIVLTVATGAGIATAWVILWGPRL